jgi:hypothetical protein
LKGERIDASFRARCAMVACASAESRFASATSTVLLTVSYAFCEMNVFSSSCLLFARFLRARSSRAFASATVAACAS